MSANTASVIGSVLPRTYGPNLKNEDAINYVKQTLRKDLPESDKSKIDADLQWSFVLDKHSSKNKNSKRSRRKKSLLTRNEKKQLGLLKLPRNGWNYENVLPMNEMWKDYMRENLDLVTKAPSYVDLDYSSFAIVLSKSEFVGAEITVARSTVPSNVGIKGIVVLETKGTFQIVTAESKFKIILKQTSVFLIILDNMRFTVFGKSLMTRPGERSVKKIKSFVVPDL